MHPRIITAIKNAPKDPGVYIFYRKQKPLYVGKAAHLKNRVRSYLIPTDYKTQALDREADAITFKKLHSDIEALIVESRLIKSLKPKYNILWRDDKNYFYVVIAPPDGFPNALPRIHITHQPHYFAALAKTKVIGPFTDGNVLKTVIRMLRRHFPYCTCRPHRRVCLNAQIGNCPGYCCNLTLAPSVKERTAYRRSLQRIISILTGTDTRFIKKLRDPYELQILDHIWKHRPYFDSSLDTNATSAVPSETDSAFPLSTMQRAECYDNSHLSGKEAVGAMTAWKHENGVWTSDRNLWRRFKIRGNYTEDDPRMMTEVVSRRLRHPEWPYPQLIVIDGGLTQYRAAHKALKLVIRENADAKETLTDIRIISFAKPHSLVYGINGDIPVPIAETPEWLQKFIQLAIASTHRYVINYHRTVRRRTLWEKTPGLA